MADQVEVNVDASTSAVLATIAVSLLTLMLVGQVV